MITGMYYTYDNPAELEDVIENTFGISQTKYSLLYSFYSIPNSVLPLFGGLLIDRFGKNTGLLVCTLFISTGCVIIAIGGYMVDFNLLLAGRTIFGFGGETMYVVNMLYLTEWFYTQEYSLACGLSGTIPNLFSSLSGFTVPLIYRYYGLGATLSVGAALCVISSLSSFGMIFLDIRARTHDTKLRQGLRGEEPVEVEKFKISDLKQFDKGFWIFVSDCFISNGTASCAIALGSNMLVSKYHFSTDVASVIDTFPYTMCIILMPFAGLLADRMGKRMTIILFCGATNIL